MRALILLFCAFLFAFVSATSGPPPPPCNEYGKCHFPSGNYKISDLGTQPYKGTAADETFKKCIVLCKRYTIDGPRHPGIQTVAWIENDGCYCGVDSIGFVLGKEGPNCRASDITCVNEE